jgi:hypothetical protein
MDPVSAVLTVVQLARALQAQLEQMQANRRDCADLAERMSALCGVIESSRGTKGWAEQNSILIQRLQRDMDGAKGLVDAIMETTKPGAKKSRVMKHFVSAGGDAEQIAELNRRITQHIQDMQAGTQAVIMRQSQEGFANVSDKLDKMNAAADGRLDRMDAMLSMLQGMLIAGRVGADMGPQQQHSAMYVAPGAGALPPTIAAPAGAGGYGSPGDYSGGSNAGSSSSSSSSSNPLHVQRYQTGFPQPVGQGQGQGQGRAPPGSYADDGSYDNAGQMAGHAPRSSSSAPAPPPAASSSSSPVSPRFGRALEVAAHQFVFGAFMAGLAMLKPDAGYRISVLILSPVLPAGLMTLVFALVSLRMWARHKTQHKKMRDEAEASGDDDMQARAQAMGAQMTLRSVLGAIGAQALVPFQLYATPTLGALAALTLTSFAGGTVGVDGIADYHSALGGVAVGTAVFALSYLANAR